MLVWADEALFMGFPQTLRCKFLLESLGEGFGVGFRWVVGGGFLVESEGKGEGTGEGGDRQRNRQVSAHAFVQTTL